jgi:hypothetical protein
VRGWAGFSSTGQQEMFSWSGMMTCDRMFDDSGSIVSTESKLLSC